MFLEDDNRVRKVCIPSIRDIGVLVRMVFQKDVLVGFHKMRFHLVLSEAVVSVDPLETGSDVRHYKPHGTSPKKFGHFPAANSFKATRAPEVYGCAP